MMLREQESKIILSSLFGDVIVVVVVVVVAAAAGGGGGGGGGRGSSSSSNLQTLRCIWISLSNQLVITCRSQDLNMMIFGSKTPMSALFKHHEGTFLPRSMGSVNPMWRQQKHKKHL